MVLRLLVEDVGHRIITVLLSLLASSACGRINYEPEPVPIPPWLGSFVAEDAFDESYFRGNHRSIGVAGDLHNLGTASIGAGSPQVSFSADLPATIGVGDELEIAGELLYVRSVGTRSAVLQSPAMAAHSGEAFQLRRAYSALQTWETDRQGDLVAEQRLEVGVAYNDGVFGESLSIAGSTTNSEYFMWLTVAEGHRHNGVAGSGATMRVSDGVNNMIGVTDEYFRVHWMALDASTDSGWVGNAISYGWGSNDGDVAYVLTHDGAFGGILFADYVNNSAVRNSIIYGFERSGIKVGGPHSQDDIALLISNTIYGNGSGISARAGLDDTYFFETHGNIVVGNDEDFGGGRIYGEGSDNISSDGSAVGNNALDEVAAGELFVSITGGATDLHLAAGAPAIDHMTNHAQVPSPDIDFDIRPITEPWDVGADEYQPIP